MHQSVYDKALAIFQEGAKKLQVKTQAIDKERIQSTIEHKLEERKVKQDLITMIKEKTRLENESILDKPAVLRREKTFSGIEIGRRRKTSTLHRQNSQDSFPPLTCTTANIPRIMRRNLSNESEFYNWVTGLPKIANRSIVALRPVTRDNAESKPTTADSSLPPKSTNTALPNDVDNRRFSKVSNIVYNVPLFSREDRKLVKSYSFPAMKHKPKLKPIADGGKRRAEIKKHSQDQNKM